MWVDHRLIEHVSSNGRIHYAIHRAYYSDRAMGALIGVVRDPTQIKGITRATTILLIEDILNAFDRPPIRNPPFIEDERG